MRANEIPENKLTIDQKIALVHATSLERIADALKCAFEFPLDLSIGKPINEHNSALWFVGEKMDDLTRAVNALVAEK